MELENTSVEMGKDYTAALTEYFNKNAQNNYCRVGFIYASEKFSF